MRILLYGATPAAFYTGGLEHQQARTGAALRSLGADVVPPDTEKVDLIHLFGANPATWQSLRLWSGSVPLVVSPVVVFGRPRPAFAERALAAPRIFGTTTARMRRDVVRRADAVVALHEGEAAFVRRAYRVPADRITVVGNGTDAASAVTPNGEPYVVVVGAVNDRKAQLELVRQWRTTFPPLLVAGGMAPGWERAAEFRRLIDERANVEWLGHRTQQEVWDLQAGALATVSGSRSEGESLALIDSLRLGRPVLVRVSSAATTLAARYSGAVLTYSGSAGLDRAIHRVPQGLPERLRPPDWSDIAARLMPLYQRLLA